VEDGGYAHLKVLPNACTRSMIVKCEGLESWENTRKESEQMIGWPSYEGAMAHPAAPPHHYRAPPLFHQAST
jgi:hypothetical protein